MVYADLHVHTNYSDGVEEVESVLQKARDKGIQVIAITDHDVLTQYDRVEKAGKDIGIKTIRGVEMSCYDFDVHKKVHMIALNFNKDHPHMDKLCSNTLKCRDEYHKKMIEGLNQKGYDITYEDAKKFSPYTIVYKMNIFQAIIEKYPEMMTKEKYIELFHVKSNIDVDLQMGYIDVKEGIEAILKDGGVPILAHPREYGNYEEIEKYISYGLKGIEINHPSLDEEDHKRIHEIAQKHHLLLSGGSDFHIEKMTTLGEYGLTQEQFLELEKALNK